MPPGCLRRTASFEQAIWQRRSSDGYYTLCGRKTDLIISGGFNIYPREIEEFLQEQPEIAEAAVIGAPDERPRRSACRVHRGKIVIRCASMERRCRENLASFKAPRQFRPRG